MNIVIKQVLFKNVFYAMVVFLLIPSALISKGKETITFKAEDGLEITADVYIQYELTKPFIILFHQAGWSRGEYLETDFTLPIESWLMNIHAGFNRVKNGEDYLDFNLAFNKDMKDFNFGFLISDTNLSGEDFRTIVTVSKDFTL